MSKFSNTTREKFYFSLQGFTIIEMVIIFGILMIISGTLITSLHTGEQQIALFTEQARIISVISRAKSLSIATFGQAGVVPCGFGVHFEAPNFLIFKDLADNCQDADRIFKYSEPNEIYESFQLDPRVVFYSVSLTDIDFIPPNPTIVITPDQAEATIILKTANGNNSAVIKVNRAGQISTQ